jgi:odorant receptor
MSFESFFIVFEKFSKTVSFDVIRPEETIAGGTRRERAIEHIKRMTKKVHFWTVIVSAVLLAFLMTIKATSQTDVKLKTETLPFIISILVDAVFGIWFWVRKKKVCEILAELKSIHPETEEDQIKYESKKIYQWFKNIQMAFLLFAMIVSVSFILNPLHETQPGERRFSVAIWLPFDGVQKGVFEVMEVILLFISVSTGALSIALFLFIFALIILVANAFERLRMDFMDIKQLSEAEKSEKLKKLVQKHVEMENLVEEVESLLGNIFMIKVIQASIVFCLTGFQLSASEKIPKMMNFGLYLLAVVVGNFFLCYGSQQIIDSSQGIAEAIYEIKWYKIKDLKLRRDLLFIMTRSQKASKLTAGKFSVVCLESFKIMLNSAVSYFALLKTVYSKQ